MDGGVRFAVCSQHHPASEAVQADGEFAEFSLFPTRFDYSISRVTRGSARVERSLPAKGMCPQPAESLPAQCLGMPAGGWREHRLALPGPDAHSPLLTQSLTNSGSANR